MVNDQMVNGFTVSCSITNTGNLDAYETPQLYVRQMSGDLVRPIAELKGFQKIWIPAGETRTVTFTLSPEDLGYWHAERPSAFGRSGFRLGWLNQRSQTCAAVYYFATDNADFLFRIAPFASSLSPDKDVIYTLDIR